MTLFNNLYLLRENTCKFKIDKQPTQGRSLEQYMTLTKISL